MAAGDNGAVSGLDAAGATYTADTFLQANGDQRQAVVLGDATGAQTAKVDTNGLLGVRANYVPFPLVTGTPRTAGGARYLLADFTGAIPDFKAIVLDIVNRTNVASDQLTIDLDDTVNGTTTTYSPVTNFAPGLAASGGINRFIFFPTRGMRPRVYLRISFGTAPTTGTFDVQGYGVGAGGPQVMLNDASGNSPAFPADGSNFNDGNAGLLVKGREYGGGGANAIVRDLHVDSDGALLPASARVVSSVTAAAGTAVTATLAAPATGYWNYITAIMVTKYAAAALTGGATPVLVTTTGISGTPTFTFGTAAAIGTVEEKLLTFDTPIRATAAATAATVVCPATTNVIWRVNLCGYVA